MCDKWSVIVTSHHNKAKNHFQQIRLLGLSNKINNVWKCMWIAMFGQYECIEY